MVKQRIDWSQDGCELSQANKQINQFWRLSLIRSCRCCDTVMWISWYMWHFEPLASNHTAGCIDVNTAGIRAVPESGRIRDGTPIYVKLDIKLGQALAVFGRTQEACIATDQLLNLPAGVRGFLSGRNPPNSHQIWGVSMKLPRTPGFPLEMGVSE